jgi:S-adenosylmethionine:tRNA ribosyltransferase-isomerase
MPLPAYIKREATELDKETYQTIFANSDRTASIAPPTAGLHFTKEIVQALQDKGVRFAYITMNIGQGIFENIEVEDLTKHRMYSEYFEINREASEIVNKSLKARKNVYAVGCSVARALEVSVLTTNAIKPNKGWTDKFIYPPFEFKVTSRLLTNFHPPQSPSLLMTAAFTGTDTLLKGYKHAMKEDYRMFAYGDAMLII